MVDEDGDYYDNVHTSDEIIQLGFDFNYALQVDSDGFKLPNGNLDDFTNHSCAPNTGIRLTPKGTIIVALRNIETHEELTYDYSTYIDNPHEGFTCGCGADSCRGVVGDFKSLPIELQRSYLDLNVVGAFVQSAEELKVRSGQLVSV